MCLFFSRKFPTFSAFEQARKLESCDWEAGGKLFREHCRGRENSPSSPWHTNARLTGTHWVLSPELGEGKKSHWPRYLKDVLYGTVQPVSTKFLLPRPPDEREISASKDQGSKKNISIFNVDFLPFTLKSHARQKNTKFGRWKKSRPVHLRCLEVAREGFDLFRRRFRSFFLDPFFGVFVPVFVLD